MPSKAVAAYQRMFQCAGGVLLDEHPVTEIIPGDVITIRTTKATFRTRKLVITAGSWAPYLLKTLGLEPPLKVLRTAAFYWKVDSPEHYSKENFPVFISYASANEFDFYGLPIHEYPGLVKICYHSGQETHPEFRDASGTTGITLTADFIRRTFKGVSQVPSIVEPCMYTMTPDTHPILDQHPAHSNIIIGAGFSGHGFKLSPVVGKILSELALGRTPSYDLSPFKLSRF